MKLQKNCKQAHVINEKLQEKLETDKCNQREKRKRKEKFLLKFDIW